MWAASPPTSPTARLRARCSPCSRAPRRARNSGWWSCRDQLRHRIRIVLRLVLVLDEEFDGARRRVALVLVAMDGAARNVDEFARFEHTRRLAFDREGDLALDHYLPLIAVMCMEAV